MIKLFFYTSVLLISFYNNSPAQSIPITDNGISKNYSFIRSVFNSITNTGGLDSFYSKLYTLKITGQGIVSIVHIGDSHIQADFLSGVVRNNLQQFFGNAGRGLVFPYQLAQSNAPSDISSSSNTRWQFNRVAHPEIPVSYGVSGYGIKTDTEGASINFSLKPGGSGPQLFNRLKFFLDSNETNSWLLQADNNSTPFLVKKAGDSVYSEIALEENTNSFSFSSLPSGNTKQFYGVSLENSSPGILYHTIGVNGARYDHYNIASLFWKQLAGLNADLFIISLGTNEAQGSGFNEAGFQKELSLFIQKIKTVAPNAAVLITTAADSYKKRKFNTVLKQINGSLVNYCGQNNIPSWDLYRITNGYGSSYNWAKKGLMNRDRIHFTAEGYRIQGTLLFSALAKGYNRYISNY
ncbi:MAG: GDSL-type esterase/lipase family protein [Bacteroidota bacterium]